MKTRWLHENSIDYIIAVTYARGKGRLFEAFFGWRQTKADGMARIILSRRGWEEVDVMIKYYNVFHKNS